MLFGLIAPTDLGPRAHRGEQDERGIARPVSGVEPGVIGRQRGLLDCNQLTRALPGTRESREGGFRDAIEAMAVALLHRGVSLNTLNSAVEEVLDAYAKDA